MSAKVRTRRYRQAAEVLRARKPRDIPIRKIKLSPCADVLACVGDRWRGRLVAELRARRGEQGVFSQPIDTRVSRGGQNDDARS